jgi:hypothetical protein
MTLSAMLVTLLVLAATLAPPRRWRVLAVAIVAGGATLWAWLGTPG